MGRLVNLRPRLGTLGPRLAAPSFDDVRRGRDDRRDHDQPWRAWYKTARWQRLRMTVLSRDLYRCQNPSCGRIEGDTSRLVCDHIEPHGGDPDRFWNGPFQTLCKSCHDGHKQRVDRAGKKAAFHPEWLRPSKIPLTIVCGAPASGKSAYVAAHARPSDLVIDLNGIAAELCGSPSHGWDRERWLHPALFKRNALLGTLSGKPRHGAAWFTVGEPLARWRQWWSDKLQPQRIIVLETAQAKCVANAARDGDRDQRTTAAAIAGEWLDYSRRPGDSIVTA